jgi:ribose 5-phosphate isomerase A
MDDESLNTLLNNIPGVVEHGVFYKLADKILIADQGIVSSM